MPSSIAPPHVHSPSSGSDHVITGAIAFSSGGLASAVIHWVCRSSSPDHADRAVGAGQGGGPPYGVVTVALHAWAPSRQEFRCNW